MGSLLHFLHRVARLALDGLNTNLVETLHKEVTVFGVDDSLHRCTQHLDTIFLQHTLLIEFHTAVQGCLSAKTQEDAVRPFLLDDALHELRCHRLEIHRIGHILRGLYCGDVGVDEHRVNAFFLQRLQSLCSAIVKLASLSYLQGPTAKKENFLDRSEGRGVRGERIVLWQSRALTTHF